MTVNYYCHDDQGQVIRRGTCPASMVVLQAIDGLSAAVGSPDPATDFISDGAVTKRPPNPAELSGMHLVSLPVPCSIIVDGIRHECADETVDLDFTPGEYAVTVESFPYLDAEFTVRI